MKDPGLLQAVQPERAGEGTDASAGDVVGKAEKCCLLEATPEPPSALTAVSRARDRSLR